MSIGYDVTNTATAVNGYVGPWTHADAPTLTIDLFIAGISGTNGKDINLFLGTIANAPAPDPADFNYYGIREYPKWPRGGGALYNYVLWPRPKVY